MGCKWCKAPCGAKSPNPQHNPYPIGDMENEMLIKQIETNVLGKDKKPLRTIVLPFELPQTVAEAVKVWGEINLLDMAIDTATVRFQAKVRGLINPSRKEGRLADPKVIEEMKGYKPISTRKPADPVKKKDAFQKWFATLSAKEQADFIKNAK